MQARTLPAARGLFWLLAGFHLYRRNPPLLSVLTFAHLLLMLVGSQLPPLGPFLLLLLSPMVVTLIANACAVTEKFGLQPLSPELLLNGVRERAPWLLRLGLLQMGYVLLVVLALDILLPKIDDALLLAGAQGTAEGAAPAAALVDPAQLGVLFLHLGLTALMVLPGFWFAPLLTAWHELSPVKSVFFSLVAVTRNWRAFLVYGVSVVVCGVLLPAVLLAFVMALPGALGGFMVSAIQLALLLVLAPVLMTAAYCGYRDIFAESHE
jgi:hypothetical protein